MYRTPSKTCSAKGQNYSLLCRIRPSYTFSQINRVLRELEPSLIWTWIRYQISYASYNMSSAEMTHLSGRQGIPLHSWTSRKELRRRLAKGSRDQLLAVCSVRLAMLWAVPEYSVILPPDSGRCRPSIFERRAQIQMSMTSQQPYPVMRGQYWCQQTWPILRLYPCSWIACKPRRRNRKDHPCHLVGSLLQEPLLRFQD